MNTSTTSRAVSALFLLAGAAASALGQVTFQPLDLGPVQAGQSTVFCSDDGKAIALCGQVGPERRALRWTALDGAAQLAAACSPNRAGDATAISANGRFIAGQSLQPGAQPGFVWSAASGVVSIGDMAGGSLTCWPEAVSDDGLIAAGVGNWQEDFIGQAFRWTAGGGFTGLGYLRPHYAYSDAVAMTADGSKIVGWSGLSGLEFRGFVWTQATGMVDLPAPPGFVTWYSPWGMTSTGSFIVGNYVTTDSRTVPVRWNAAGQITVLGNVPGGPADGAAWASSHDGNIIIGFDHYTYNEVTEHSIAMIWDPVNGPRDLQQMLATQHGVDFMGWTLTSATDLSADGTVIVGRGLDPQGGQGYWKIEMPQQPCVADINKDGLVDFADYLEFLNFFDAGC